MPTRMLILNIEELSQMVLNVLLKKSFFPYFPFVFLSSSLAMHFSVVLKNLQQFYCSEALRL